MYKRQRLFGGALDGQTRTSVRLTEQLDQLGIPYQFAKVPGVGHQERKLYEGLGPQHFQFYRDVFGGGVGPTTTQSPAK